MKVNLNEVEFDQTFNLKVVNGADAITVAKFNETDANFLALLKEGDNAIPYASTKNKKVDLQTAYGTSIYSVTQNGTTLSPRFATTPNSYQFEVAPDDNIEVTVFDPATLGSDVELTLDIPAGMEKVVKNIRNWTTSKFIESEIADGVSGGNIDVNILNRIINRGLAKTGRLCQLELAVQDKPGTLSSVLKIVADEGGNILGVNHERVAAAADINSCMLHLELETLNDDHIARIRRSLGDAGFQVL